jgi:nucleoside transporter
MVSAARGKLAGMMFLQFFIWGSWYELVFGYVQDLGFTAGQQSLALATFNLAALVAMFFSTQFADRHFAAQKFLAFSQLVGGLALLALGQVTTFGPFFVLLLIHSLFYVPTLSIANSIAFAHLRNPQKDFGLVRVWGTIGWIAASWPFIFLLADWERVPRSPEQSWFEWLTTVLATGKTGAARTEAVAWTFRVGGLASLLLAAYSLWLPHTPPRPAEQAAQRFAWLQALRLLRLPFVAILFLVTWVDAWVLHCYFIWTDPFLRSIEVPSNWVLPAMKISQVAEILTMALLGYVLTRWGWRWTMAVGILGHTLRFAVFALLPQPVWFPILVNVVHGICYAFFFATVYIFVDAYFPKDARASAQALFNFLILGAGPLVGNFSWPRLGEWLTTGSGPDYPRLFLVPATTALAAAGFLLLFFWPPPQPTSPAAPSAPAESAAPSASAERDHSLPSALPPDNFS